RHRIAGKYEHDRNRAGAVPGRQHRWHSGSNDHVDVASNELCKSFRDLRRVHRLAKLEREALPLDETMIAQSLQKALDPLLGRRTDAKEADALDCASLLRVGPERPRGRRCRQEDGELPPPHFWPQRTESYEVPML